MKRPVKYTLEIPDQRGWGNGYVLIPKDHPLYGWHGDDIMQVIDIRDEITYSKPATTYVDLGLIKSDYKDWWIVGFDTNHLSDNKTDQDRSYVQEGTEELLNAIESYSPKDEDEAVTYWKQRCLAAEDFIANTPCDPDITSDQIDAYQKWINKQ